MSGNSKINFKKIGLEKGVNVTDSSKRSTESLIRKDVRYVPYEIIGIR